MSSRRHPRLAVALLAASAFLAPMVSVRVAPWLLLADVLLLFAIAAAVMSGVRVSIAAPMATMLAFPYAIAVGGLLSSSSDTASAIEVAKFFFAVVGTIFAVAIVHPSRDEARFIAMAYAWGAAASAATGLAFGIVNQGGRVVGLSGHPNHLALPVAIAFVMLVGMWIDRERSVSRVHLATLTVFLGFALVFTGSRTGALVAVTALAIMILKGRDRRLVAFLGLGVTVAVGAVSLGVVRLNEFSVLARLRGGGRVDESDADRVSKLSEAWNAIGERPLLGVSFGDLHFAHSVPLQLWYGAGVIGALAFVAALVGVVAVTLVLSTDSRFLLSLWAVFASYLVVSAVANQLWDRYLWIPFALAAVGLCWPEPAGKDRTSSVSSEARELSPGISPLDETSVFPEASKRRV